ncbi:MAG: hypothetical protein Q8P05_01470 [Candidatus Diapherotrites archaeon]|nr:hypothetical protein [Candidatus Diapherotrites archaeon]
MQTTSQNQYTPSPTLDTIRMVEETIRQAPTSVIKLADLKRLLPRQVNHNTLKVILEYLEESGKIYVGIKGIAWIENNNPRFREMLEKSWVYEGPGHLEPYRKRDL